MIYTIEAKQEMDRIIGVFADYIQKQSFSVLMITSSFHQEGPYIFLPPTCH